MVARAERGSSTSRRSRRARRPNLALSDRQHHHADEWKQAATQLAAAQATGKAPGEPRFWARVAWAHFMFGDMTRFVQARNKVFWFSKKAEVDQMTQLVNAASLLGSGLPGPALEMTTKLAGRRPHGVRVYAYLDLGNYKEAIREAEQWYKDAPQLVEAEALLGQARMMAAGSTASARRRRTRSIACARRRTASWPGTRPASRGWRRARWTRPSFRARGRDQRRVGRGAELRSRTAR